jgi:hypothetical protein
MVKIEGGASAVEVEVAVMIGKRLCQPFVD